MNHTLVLAYVFGLITPLFILAGIWTGRVIGADAAKAIHRRNLKKIRKQLRP